MMNNKEIDEFLQLLQKYELSIAALYESFASALPQFQDAWMAFVKEERIHAKWIGQLQAHLKNENVSFDQKTYTLQATKIAINYLEKLVEQAKKDKPDLLQALNIAIDIEKSLLESAFLKVFKLDGPKARQIQTRLREATKIHMNRLVDWRADIQNA